MIGCYFLIVEIVSGAGLNLAQVASRRSEMPLSAPTIRLQLLFLKLY